MNHELQQAKRMIRPYLRVISETALWQLCAEAKDGRIEYCLPCRCVRGIVGGGTLVGYYSENSYLALAAEEGLYLLGFAASETYRKSDHYRNIRLLPMVRAEIRRRERMAAQPSPEFAGRREE